MNIFVSNLSFHTNDEDLKTLFSQYGEVTSARVMTDKATARSRGFGFVEMTQEEEGQQAIKELHGKTIEGRDIAVSVARPREERPSKYSSNRY